MPWKTKENYRFELFEQFQTTQSKRRNCSKCLGKLRKTNELNCLKNPKRHVQWEATCSLAFENTNGKQMQHAIRLIKKNEVSYETLKPGFRIERSFHTTTTINDSTAGQIEECLSNSLDENSIFKSHMSARPKGSTNVMTSFTLL